MLKKYKILTSIILFSLLGIVGIMGVWLIENYRNHSEIVASDIDRSLFNTIQTYYENHHEETSGSRLSFTQVIGANFAHEMRKRDLHIDSALILSIWDSIITTDIKSENLSKIHKSHRFARGIIPGYMLQDMQLTSETIVRIDSLLKENLILKGIRFDVKLSSQILEKRPTRRNGITRDAEGNLHTRPVLVNPQENLYLVGMYKEPIWHILSLISLQIVLAFVIFAALLGGFYYLVWTINKQNRLALMRRSFVNNMTHELKTPLATVMAALEAIQRYSAKDNKEKTAQFLQISQRELHHLDNIIDKVLKLDINEEEGVVLQKDRVVVHKLLTECVETAYLGAKKPVNIHYHPTEDSLVIFADYSHLKNVFNNILDNAIKYTEDKVEIHISVKEEGRYLSVAIEDNGLGIDPIYQKDIFDMFFRVPNGHLHPVKGFGLGLPYVKQVIEKHGGQVKIMSKLYNGSCFTVLIPKM